MWCDAEIVTASGPAEQSLAATAAGSWQLKPVILRLRTMTLEALEIWTCPTICAPQLPTRVLLDPMRTVALVTVPDSSTTAGAVPMRAVLRSVMFETVTAGASPPPVVVSTETAVLPLPGTAAQPTSGLGGGGLSQAFGSWPASGTGS